MPQAHVDGVQGRLRYGERGWRPRAEHWPVTVSVEHVDRHCVPASSAGRSRASNGHARWRRRPLDDRQTPD
jgi:hypothetical protein